LHERKKIENSLRETETLYRTLVEQTSVVTYRDFPDVNGATIYISPQIETLLGYSLNEWQENPTIWKRLTHPDDLPKVLAEIENYIASGKRTKIEYRMQALDGQWIWVQDESIVIKDDSGTPQYVHGVLIDITERKQAEEKVQQRSNIELGCLHRSTAFEGSNWRRDGVFLRLGERQGQVTYIFGNHPGTDGSALSSQKYEWVAPGIKPDIDNPVYQNSRLSPSPGLEDWYANLSTGIPFYGSGKQYPRYWKRVFDERGVKTLLDVPIFVNDQWWGIIGFDDYVNEMPWSQAEIDALVAAAGNLGVAIERQQSDKALRASEEKFQAAFHRTFVPMVISRAHDQIILDVNEAFCKGAGYSRNEAVGKTAVELNLWANQEDQLKHEAVLAKQGYAGEFKAEFRRKSGETGVALISAIMILLGEEPCFLHTVYDISKIDQLVNELRTKNEELQNFTYTVSHDLKAPLITISGFLGYLEEDAQKGDLDKVRKDSLRINEAVAKMQRLLSELLELSRIGRLMNLPQYVPFGDIVQEALRLVEGRLEANQVKVQVEAGLPTVNGDRVRLVEVVQNLVDNAAKFMGDQKNPTIEIGTITENDETVFLVRDNGIGIEPEQHERIFGLFNKLDTLGCTGIGLTLVKRIVDVWQNG
jgi:PAS domain S-box-containing protein